MDVEILKLREIAYSTNEYKWFKRFLDFKLANPKKDNWSAVSMAYQGAVEAAQRADRLPKGTSHASVVPPVHQSDSNDAGNGSSSQRFGWWAMQQWVVMSLDFTPFSCHGSWAG